MPKKSSLLDDLITLPWWFNLALAGVVYFSLKYYLPTVEFNNPAFQGIGKAFPNMAGTRDARTQGQFDNSSHY